LFWGHICKVGKVFYIWLETCLKLWRHFIIKLQWQLAFVRISGSNVFIIKLQWQLVFVRISGSNVLNNWKHLKLICNHSLHEWFARQTTQNVLFSLV
jgi:hypothetical protein